MFLRFLVLGRRESRNAFVPNLGNGINLSDTVVKRYRITITTISSEESIGS